MTAFRRKTAHTAGNAAAISITPIVVAAHTLLPEPHATVLRSKPQTLTVTDGWLVDWHNLRDATDAKGVLSVALAYLRHPRHPSIVEQPEPDPAHIRIRVNATWTLRATHHNGTVVFLNILKTIPAQQTTQPVRPEAGAADNQLRPSDPRARRRSNG